MTIDWSGETTDWLHSVIKSPTGGEQSGNDRDIGMRAEKFCHSVTKTCSLGPSAVPPTECSRKTGVTDLNVGRDFATGSKGSVLQSPRSHQIASEAQCQNAHPVTRWERLRDASLGHLRRQPAAVGTLVRLSAPRCGCRRDHL